MLAVFLSGCGLFGKGPNTPARETAHAGLVFTARAVVVADEFCEVVARALAVDGKRDAAIELATKCTQTHRATIALLEGAEKALDAGDSSRVLCATLKGTSALESVMSAGALIGLAPPTALVDAVAFARPFMALAGGGCQ